MNRIKPGLRPRIPVDDRCGEFAWTKMPSPVGELTLIASAKGLVAVLWESDTSALSSQNRCVSACSILADTERQLIRYFAGERTPFDLPLDFRGTDFQRQVWRALLEIPYGETRTYAELASMIGNVNAARAVGAANGKNPIAIIAPCHRVIGASGHLTGFAGGLSAKAHLLALESGKAISAATATEIATEIV